ncbi:hypothetical protein [Lysinibacillus fusiformis]|uniref:hypothetical protein n=1 Tax=Lysinibacillus fusiformis TaxID=28031 RepID=UPI003D041222
MEYSRSRKFGVVEIYETFEGDVNEIAELNKSLASHKAVTVKENKKSLVDRINECPETATIQASNIEFNQWKTEIAKLAKRNIDIGLLKEFSIIGPKCLNEILVLNSLSDEDLDKYCELYREKEKLSLQQIYKMSSSH